MHQDRDRKLYEIIKEMYGKFFKKRKENKYFKLSIKEIPLLFNMAHKL